MSCPTSSWHFSLLGSSSPWVTGRCAPARPAEPHPPPPAPPGDAAPPPGVAVGTLPEVRLLRLAVHRVWPRKGREVGSG